MKILLIDNYDSFTYNLYHLIKAASTEEDSIEIILNDKLSIETAEKFDRIIISPGPGLPSEVAILKNIVLTLGQQIPILGICLGHQAIAESYGASIFNFDKPTHGISSTISVTRSFRFISRHEYSNISRSLPFVERIEARFPRLPEDYSKRQRREYHGVGSSETPRIRRAISSRIVHHT